MKTIQSPTVMTQMKGYYPTTIFLAGGISGCENWQDYVCKKFDEDYLEDPHTFLVNPRRVGDLSKEGEEAKEQIEWEHKYLDEADYIMFWFPKETVCPITLFELGRYSRNKNDLIIGIHPEYSRRFDVETQMRAIHGNFGFVYSLDELITETADIIGLDRRKANVR